MSKYKKTLYNYHANVNLSPEQRDEVLKMCKETGMTRSEIIRMGVDAILAEYKESLSKDNS